LILVDTSVWIDFFNGCQSKEEQILKSLLKAEEDICLAGINVMEILQGIKQKESFLKTERYLREFPIFAPDLEVYVLASLIFNACQKKGHTVSSTDCLIAADAIENDLVLLHKDKDFEYIQACTDLQIFPI